MERSSCAIRTACDIQIDRRRGAGRPKLTWKKLTEKDCCEWKLTTVDPQERNKLHGKGPTDVDDALHLHVNQKSDYDDIMT